MLARDTSLQQRCTMPRFIHGEHLPERTEAMQRARSNQPPSRSKCSKTVARRHHSDDCNIPVFGSTPTKRASNGSENRGHCTGPSRQNVRSFFFRPRPKLREAMCTRAPHLQSMPRKEALQLKSHIVDSSPQAWPLPTPGVYAMLVPIACAVGAASLMAASTTGAAPAAAEGVAACAAMPWPRATASTISQLACSARGSFSK
mmetsp:Transcript_11417/g.30652  ORF Transcript_11417/g.30652 Transcript_11417/m.30652 type:complete len:202 (-) Transcript_11417:452-1057(-)